MPSLRRVVTQVQSRHCIQGGHVAQSSASTVDLITTLSNEVTNSISTRFEPLRHTLMSSWYHLGRKERVHLGMKPALSWWG